MWITNPNASFILSNIPGSFLLPQAAKLQTIPNSGEAPHAGQAGTAVARAGGTGNFRIVYQAVGNPVHHVKQLLFFGLEGVSLFLPLS